MSSELIGKTIKFQNPIIGIGPLWMGVVVDALVNSKDMVIYVVKVPAMRDMLFDITSSSIMHIYDNEISASASLLRRTLKQNTPLRDDN